MSDRGKDTGRALTEVRTVLSRARTALAVLEAAPSEYDYKRDEKGLVIPGSAFRFEDPEQDEMVEALRQTVVLLSRWERRGRR